MTSVPRQFTHAIPLAASTTTLIVKDRNGGLTYTTDRDAKMDALLDGHGCDFFAVWPGTKRSDLFRVDRREALKALARG